MRRGEVGGPEILARPTCRFRRGAGPTDSRAIKNHNAGVNAVYYPPAACAFLVTATKGGSGKNGKKTKSAKNSPNNGPICIINS